jgi:rare lipoprotein A
MDHNVRAFKRSSGFSDVDIAYQLSRICQDRAPSSPSHRVSKQCGDRPQQSRPQDSIRRGLRLRYAASEQKDRERRTFRRTQTTAASKTLPLNSEAKVTNLKTGRSVDVTITDRGPYAKHRVIDLSPAAAKEVGIDKKEGVARVEVKPDETLQ